MKPNTTNFKRGDVIFIAKPEGMPTGLYVVGESKGLLFVHHLESNGIPQHKFHKINILNHDIYSTALTYSFFETILDEKAFKLLYEQ